MSCDDGFACTFDTCVAGTCRHTIGPNMGTTACPSGQYCQVGMGCVQAPACAVDQDCVTAWKGDPCKTNPTCDPVTATCTFTPLDNDMDGYPPIACGGSDCNDNDPTIHPGATELCDGVDNDCDGLVDNGASATCPANEACTMAQCVCPPENVCQTAFGSECTDKQTDPKNCGGCGITCKNAETCQGGTCVCPPEALCGGTCTDLQWDPKNCGACGVVCPATTTCEAGACVCTDPTRSMCGAICVDLGSDPKNCGACGNKCASGSSCCGGTCIDTTSDSQNCGACGNDCANQGCSFCTGVMCSAGSCTCTGCQGTGPTTGPSTGASSSGGFGGAGTGGAGSGP